MAQTTAPVLCQSQLVATVNDYSNTQAKTPVPLDNSHSGQGGRSRRATTGSLGKPETAKVAPWPAASIFTDWKQPTTS